MYQEIITFGIGIGVIFYLSIKLYRFFFDKKKQTAPCNSCSICCLNQTSIPVKNRESKSNSKDCGSLISEQLTE